MLSPRHAQLNHADCVTQQLAGCTSGQPGALAPLQGQFVGDIGAKLFCALIGHGSNSLATLLSRRCHLRPIKTVFGRPALPAAEFAVAFDFYLRGELHQATVRDAGLDPGVHAGRLDAQHAGHRRDAAKGSDDFVIGHGAGHAPLLGIPIYSVNSFSLFIFISID